MRWGIFIGLAFIFITLEASLMGIFEISLPTLGGIRPSLTAVLALYVTLWAPRMTALWACFALGLLVDLTSPINFPPAQDAHLLGPNALGFSFACALALQVRAMVMKRQLFATSILTLVFIIAASIVVVAIMTVRSHLPFAYELPVFSPTTELLRRFAVAGYTGLVAVPLGWLLLKSNPAWHFHTNNMSSNWR